MAGGLDPDTPAAAVRWGTRADQHTVRATLATLADRELRPPCTIVVGPVAAERLDWFERRPLLGRRVVVTRARDQAGELADRLRLAGADVVEVPTIELAEPSDGGSGLRDVVRRVDGFDWVVLTSPNGARRFTSLLRDGRDLAGVRLAAIGPGTAAALAEAHLVADLVPERYVAESLLEAFPDPPDGRGPGAPGPGRGGTRRPARRPGGAGLGRGGGVGLPDGPGGADRPAACRGAGRGRHHLHVVVHGAAPGGRGGRGATFPRWWPRSARSPPPPPAGTAWR